MAHSLPYQFKPDLRFKNAINGYAVIYQDSDGNTNFNDSTPVYLGTHLPQESFGILMSENPIEELLKVAQTQDMRIDYNFNTILQTSILVEFLFLKLSELNPDLKMEELFNDFQQKRIAELKRLLKKLNKLKDASEDLEEATDELIKEEILKRLTCNELVFYPTCY